ncbi:MAG TPA: hypothetical protein VK154_01890 [Chitinophagales bacterium]|nr:hypothetical protein [Chitinophagales bacterium]
MILEFILKQWGWIAAFTGAIFLFNNCDSEPKSETPVTENKASAAPIRHYEAFDLLNSYSPEIDGGKEITVNGTVHGVFTDQNGSVYVLLKDEENRYSSKKYVECYISTFSQVRPESLKVGEYTQIQGRLGQLPNENVVMISCKINPY